MPAGDLDKLKFAFAYGADAVYAGVPIYSLRARENGFNQASIAEGLAYARRLNKRVYLTMNIFAHNSKIDGFLKSFCENYDLAPHGFIMSDVGLIKKALALRPDAVIHLSTQANACNWAAVEFWRDLGVRRIILSRELSLKEIALIHNKVPDIELESFVHGAICIAYSGRCLISNYLNHRDANQGTCTNSCRWQYRLGMEKGSIMEVENSQISKPNEHYTPLGGSYYVKEQKREEERFALDEDEHGTYLMNSKDLCAIELLEQLRHAGICSFKAEGRTKSIYYLSTVTRAYRRAIDDLADGKPFNKDNLRELFTTSSRTFTTGFLLRRPVEYGENYDDGDSLPLTHRYSARVLDYIPEKQLARLDVRNKITIGDTIEWITPQQTVCAKIEALIDPRGKPLESASGGTIVETPAPLPADPFTLVRSPISN